MTLSNVKLIFAKEVRDQLRDRRTLFMIAVLPVFLYPLLGISMLQVAQFMQKQATRVLVVGADKMTGSPTLFKDGQFADGSEAAKLLELHFATKQDLLLAEPTDAATPADHRASASALVQLGEYDAALYFPPDFAARLNAFHEAVRQRAEHRRSGHIGDPIEFPLAVPSPEIIQNTTSDKSRVAFLRLSRVLDDWTARIRDANLKTSGVSISTMRPFLVSTSDVADATHRNGAMWSKILPMLLLLWALTGAFYPAIDLCAGEKERGTLETLLSSPAQRSEIVLGKLLTVMLFSVATAALNLASMGITGCLVVSRMPGLGPPPLTAILALGLALLPIAALFSALCVGLAAFARSAKEGQYYLMPLLLITMPLVILPMAPGVELNVGNSLIPLTGIVLLLRTMLEGNYWQALQYSPIVAAVTLLACFMSIRWAIEQFNSEAVLFRESERWDLRLWLRRVLRDRGPTPTAFAAGCCAMLILTVQFFMNFSFSAPTDLGGLARAVLIPQLLVILPPVLLMTFLSARSPRETLLLKRPDWLAIPAAAVLALALHPLSSWLQTAVQWLYPVSDDMVPQFARLQRLFDSSNLWVLLLLIAVLPAVCEELAFRGFILSGFRHLGHKRLAIVCRRCCSGWPTESCSNR